MPTLYITDDDEGESELVKVKIAKMDPAAATIAILGALAKIEPEKKTRSDRGKKRAPKLDFPNSANGERTQVTA